MDFTHSQGQKPVVGNAKSYFPKPTRPHPAHEHTHTHSHTVQTHMTTVTNRLSFQCVNSHLFPDNNNSDRSGAQRSGPTGVCSPPAREQPQGPVTGTAHRFHRAKTLQPHSKLCMKQERSDTGGFFISANDRTVVFECSSGAICLLHTHTFTLYKHPVVFICGGRMLH